MGDGELAAHDAPPDDRALWDALGGMFACPAVLVSRELGLYRALAAGPLGVDALRARLEVAERPLRALLSLNEAARFLARDEAGSYALTTVARAYLLDDSPTSFGGFFDMVAAFYPTYSLENLRRAVRTDEPVLYGGADTFRTHDEQAALARQFTRGMHGMSAGPARCWPRVVDLAGAGHLLDLGGGSGAHAVEAARAWPALRVTVLDLAPVCDVARETAAAAGVSDRVRAEPFDLWSGALPEADAHFYSMILHDWSPEKCLELLRRSFAALPSGGRVLVHEMFLDDGGGGPLAVAEFGVSMLFGTKGRQYSAEEVRSWLREAGFVEPALRPTTGYWALLSARKP